MKEKSLHHTQLPNEMVADGLKPRDLFIYICIRSFVRDSSLSCYPSLQTISEKAGCTVPTVIAAIKRLTKKGYIKIDKKGKKNIYIFTKLINYEPFGDVFIDKQNVSFGAKGYLVSSQLHMFKDSYGIGKLSMSDSDLAACINTSEKSIKRYDNELMRNNYLTIVKNKGIDSETGCKTRTKIFDLEKLGLAIIWTLKDHEERITDTENRINRLEEKNERLEKENKEQKKLIDALLRERGVNSKPDFII